MSKAADGRAWRSGLRRWSVIGLTALFGLSGLLAQAQPPIRAQEITAEGEAALARGLDWLAANQGPEGNWESTDLGLVSMGLLAFLADGHFPGRGKYGEPMQKSLNHVVAHVGPRGLLNIGNPQREMYNHGLSTFVLGQAYGMVEHERLAPILDEALQLIAATQCRDGGWDYTAQARDAGHDLSLVVMQAKALRSAVDSGFEVSPHVVQAAIKNVREHYAPDNRRMDAQEELQRQLPGQFCYLKNGRSPTTAMAAAGVVCLQEFGQYDDWRIEKNMAKILKAVRQLENQQSTAMDPYTLYYVAQAAYQVGDPWWSEIYPILRDYLVRIQVQGTGDRETDGRWPASGYVAGKPGDLYATSVSCFVLAIPNRYLPILQEGRIEGIREQFTPTTNYDHSDRPLDEQVPGETWSGADTKRVVQR